MTAAAFYGRLDMGAAGDRHYRGDPRLGGIFVVAAGILKIIFWVATALIIIGLFAGRRAV